MKRPDGWDELYLEAYRKEHMSGALYGSPERAMFEAGADAYAKKIYEWGNEPCREHHEKANCINLWLKHECEECWQGLLEEVE